MEHLLKKKCVVSRVNVHILTSTSVLFTLTVMQLPNLKLTHEKRITVCAQSYTNGVLTKLDHPSKNGKNKYDIKWNFSFILYGIVMSRAAVFFLPIALKFPVLGLCERKNVIEM
jgi:hypothetical protein